MMTPKEFLISHVEKFNAGDITSLINMYEIDGCFVSQEGKVIKGTENIRQILHGFINMNGNLESKVNAAIQTTDIALVNTEWAFTGTGPEGKPVTITGKATDVLRQQSDETWRILIVNPWGANLQMHDV